MPERDLAGDAGEQVETLREHGPDQDEAEDLHRAVAHEGRCRQQAGHEGRKDKRVRGEAGKAAAKAPHTFTASARAKSPWGRIANISIRSANAMPCSAAVET